MNAPTPVRLPDNVAAQWNGPDDEKRPFFEDLKLAAELKIADTEANQAAAYYRGMQDAEDRVASLRAAERACFKALGREGLLWSAALCLSLGAAAILVMPSDVLAALVLFVAGLLAAVLGSTAKKHVRKLFAALAAAQEKDDDLRKVEVARLAALVAKADEVGEQYKERMKEREAQVVKLAEPIPDDVPVIGQKPVAIDAPQDEPPELGPAPEPGPA